MLFDLSSVWNFFSYWHYSVWYLLQEIKRQMRTKKNEDYISILDRDILTFMLCTCENKTNKKPPWIYNTILKIKIYCFILVS